MGPRSRLWPLVPEGPSVCDGAPMGSFPHGWFKVLGMKHLEHQEGKQTARFQDYFSKKQSCFPETQNNF